MRGVLVTAFILSLGVILSGCVSIPSSTFKARYSGIVVHLDVNYTEVERINISEVEPKLNTIGFVRVEGAWRNYTYNSTYNKTFVEMSIFINAYIKNNNTTAYFDIDYVPFTPSRDDQNEKDNITTYIKTRVNEVATICNLTLDWDKATWKWNYKD